VHWLISCKPDNKEALGLYCGFNFKSAVMRISKVLFLCHQNRGLYLFPRKHVFFYIYDPYLLLKAILMHIFSDQECKPTIHMALSGLILFL